MVKKTNISHLLFILSKQTYTHLNEETNIYIYKGVFFCADLMEYMIFKYALDLAHDLTLFIKGKYLLTKILK